MEAFEILVDFSKLPDQSLCATKRGILRKRGLRERFPITGSLPSELLDAVAILHMTELELYFLNDSEALEPTPRTRMNSLVYLFKFLRDNRESLLGGSNIDKNRLVLLEGTLVSLHAACDEFFRFVIIRSF